jgi:ureidoglycolate lyase
MISMQLHAITATDELFAPFGQIIHADSAAKRWPINAGATMRHHRAANIVCEGAAPIISVFEALEIPAPGYEIRLIENHPYGSQAFIPLAGQQLIVVVGKPGAADVEALQCFRLDGRGASFAPGVWHATLIAPDGGSFLVVDRDDPDTNCEALQLDSPIAVHW